MKNGACPRILSLPCKNEITLNEGNLQAYIDRHAV